MSTEAEEVQELVHQMYEVAENARWDLAPENIRVQRRRRMLIIPDAKILALVTTAAVLVITGFWVFRPASHKTAVTTPSTTTTSSTPARTIVVPNLVGLTQAAAGSTLGSAGLNIGTVTASPSSLYPAGVIVSSQPSAGASMAPGSSVQLVVSSGSSGTVGFRPAASTTTTNPVAVRSTTPTSAVADSNSLKVSVTSVTAVLTPYNPAYSSGGIPAEEVSFTITGAVSSGVTCYVEVLQGGATVGSTTATVGLPISTQSATASESIDVSPLSVTTFNGSQSDARVTCHS